VTRRSAHPTGPRRADEGPRRIEVRGEVYLPRKVFERINKEKADAGEPLFANPRNAAAGTMRNLDPALVAKRGLSAWMYQLAGGPEGPPLRPARQVSLYGQPDRSASRESIT
jgi:NAD-dependent DNA ligase